jgi:polysaccharide biosynthesis protein PslH
LMTDPAERRRLASAGRQRMLTHHNWSESMKRLDAIVERCVSHSSVSSHQMSLS